VLLPIRHGRDAKLQLREALRNAKGEWARRGGYLDGRRAGRAVQMRRDTLPGDASSVVQLSDWRISQPRRMLR
jgi:hypothetical protein